MSNPLSILADGLTAAATHWQALLGVIFILLISQFLMFTALRKIFGSQLAAEEYYSLSLAGWLLPASLISLIWYVGGMVLSPLFGLFAVIAFVLVVGLFLRGRSSNTSFPSSMPISVSLLLLTIISIILRMAYVARTVLPMYFDSAQHYLFAKNILNNLNHAGVLLPLTNYYHLGFHFLTAFLTFITRTAINDVMLLLGQVILTVMPFAAFFIVRHWTQSNLAAIFALLLAAFGWYMPAHAVDWGKYPALASLGLMPFAISIAYLSLQNRRWLSASTYWALNAILLPGIIISIFLHSRALIMFGLVALSAGLALLWKKFAAFPRLVLLGMAILALVLEINWILKNGLLTLLFDPYGLKAVLITASVILLSLFAWRMYPAFVFSCIVLFVLLLVSVFVPLGNLIPGYANMTLLDRPFVEMILYLPLTLLGGFGLAALEQTLQEKKVAWRNTLSKVISVFFIMLVIVNAGFNYDLYPADCCDIASADDRAAIRWMDAHLPPDARILISSTELRVLPTDAYQGSAGGDAGTWITPLIGRATIYMPYTTDFSQPQTLQAICQLRVGYVYVGKTGSGFEDANMPVLPNAYQVLFALPTARVYQVTGCDQL